MTPTVEFIQKSFDKFNALCFDGSLPPVTIVLSKATSFLGKMEYRLIRGFFGRVVSRDRFRLKISTEFDLSEEESEDVIIHEMIHYYIAYHKIHDSSTHGKVFRQMMEDINRKYGRHISIRHKGEPARLRQPRTNIICVSSFPDGKIGITVCSPSKVAEIRRLLPRYYQLTGMEWFESSDPFFNRFPRSRTPKIYRIDPEALSEHIQTAVQNSWSIAP